MTSLKRNFLTKKSRRIFPKFCWKTWNSCWGRNWKFCADFWRCSLTVEKTRQGAEFAPPPSQWGRTNNIDIVWSQTWQTKTSVYITLVFPIQEFRRISYRLATLNLLCWAIVYRESFSEFKRKSQAFALNFSLTRTVLFLPQAGKEVWMILVGSFASRGRVSVGISSIRGSWRT